jgi:hypothetical protein
MGRRSRLRYFEGAKCEAYVKDVPLDRLAVVAYGMNGALLQAENSYPARLANKQRQPPPTGARNAVHRVPIEVALVISLCLGRTSRDKIKCQFRGET